MTSSASPIQPSLPIEAGKLPHHEQISAQKWGHTFTKIAYASAAVAAVAFTVALVAAAVFFTGGAALPVFIALGAVAALSGGGALIAKFFQEKMGQKERSGNEDNLLASRLYEILGKDMTIEDFKQIKSISDAAEDKSKVVAFLELVNKRNQGEEISDQKILDAYFEIKVPEGSDVLKGGLYAKIQFKREPVSELPYANLESRLKSILGNQYSLVEAKNLLNNFKSPLEQITVSKALDALESSSEINSTQLQKLGDVLANTPNSKLKEVLYGVISRKLGFNVKLAEEWIEKNNLTKEQRDLAWFYAANVHDTPPLFLGNVMKEYRKIPIHANQGEFFDVLMDIKAEKRLGELNNRLKENPDLKKTVETSQFLEELSTYPRFYGNPLTHLEKITDLKSPPFLTLGEIADDIENNILPSGTHYFVSEMLDTRVIGTYILQASDKPLNDPNAYYAPKLPTPTRTLFQRIPMPVNASLEQKAKMISNLTKGELPKTHDEIALLDESMLLTPGLGNKRNYSGMLLAELDETSIPLEHKAALEQLLKPLEQRELAIILQKIRVEGLSKQLQSLTVDQAKKLIDQNATLPELRLFVLFPNFKNDISKLKLLEKDEKLIQVISLAQPILMEINKIPDEDVKQKMLNNLIASMNVLSQGALGIPKGGYSYSDLIENMDRLTGNPVLYFVKEKINKDSNEERIVIHDFKIPKFSEFKDEELGNGGLKEKEIELVRHTLIKPEELTALRDFMHAAKELKNAPRDSIRTAAVINASFSLFSVIMNSHLRPEDKKSLLIMANRLMSPSGSYAPFSYNELKEVLPQFEGKNIYAIKSDSIGNPCLQKIHISNGEINIDSTFIADKSPIDLFQGRLTTDSLMYSARDAKFVNFDFNDLTLHASTKRFILKNAEGEDVEVKITSQILMDLQRADVKINGRFFPIKDNKVNDRTTQVLQALFESVGYDSDKLFNTSIILHQGALGTVSEAALLNPPANTFIRMGSVVLMNVNTEKEPYNIEYMSEMEILNSDDLSHESNVYLSRNYRIPSNELKNGIAEKGSYFESAAKTPINTILNHVPEAMPEVNALCLAILQAKDINDPDSLEKIVIAQSNLLKIIEKKKREPYYFELLKEINNIISPDGKPNAIRLEALIKIKDRFSDQVVHHLFYKAGNLFIFKGSLTPNLKLSEVVPRLPEIYKKADPFFEGNPKIEEFDLGARALDRFWQEPEMNNLVSYSIDGKTWQIPALFLKDVSRSDFEINGLLFPITEKAGRTEEIMRLLINEAGGDEKKLQRLLILCTQDVSHTLKNDIGYRAQQHYSPANVMPQGGDSRISINALPNNGIIISRDYNTPIKNTSNNKTILNLKCQFDFKISANDLEKGYGETSQVLERFSHIDK